jgi:hypothetical protein
MSIFFGFVVTLLVVSLVAYWVIMSDGRQATWLRRHLVSVLLGAIFSIYLANLLSRSTRTDMLENSQSALYRVEARQMILLAADECSQIFMLNGLKSPESDRPHLHRPLLMYSIPFASRFRHLEIQQLHMLVTAHTASVVAADNYEAAVNSYLKAIPSQRSSVGILPKSSSSQVSQGDQTQESAKELERAKRHLIEYVNATSELCSYIRDAAPESPTRVE